MRKIKSLFVRDWEGDRSLVTGVVDPAAQWVIDGEGIATRKFDGTSCFIDARGRLFRRYDAKRGKTPPTTFIPAQAPDPETGHWPGWIPVGSGAADQYHREAYENSLAGLRGTNRRLPTGTYEAVGPKFQGNPDNFNTHLLVPHGDVKYPHCPRDFYGLKDFIEDMNIEGIVWHRYPNRGTINQEFIKIKGTDFGLKRKTNG